MGKSSRVTVSPCFLGNHIGVHFYSGVSPEYCKRTHAQCTLPPVSHCHSILSLSILKFHIRVCCRDEVAFGSWPRRTKSPPRGIIARTPCNPGCRGGKYFRKAGCGGIQTKLSTGFTNTNTTPFPPGPNNHHNPTYTLPTTKFPPSKPHSTPTNPLFHPFPPFSPPSSPPPKIYPAQCKAYTQPQHPPSHTAHSTA